MLVTLSLGILSCSDDDKNSSSEQNPLVGKWNFISELALDAQGNLVSSDIDDNGSCPLDIYEFLNEGTFNHVDYDYSLEPTNCNPDKYKGTWSITDTTFKLKEDGEDELSFIIVKQTATEFEVQKTLSRNDKGDYELNVVSLKYVFKKI